MIKMKLALCFLMLTMGLSAFGKVSFYDVRSGYSAPANIEVSFRLGDDRTGEAPKKYNINKALEIFEDGQQLSQAEGSKLSIGRPTSFNVDILLVIDLSGSVAAQLNKVKEAAKSFVEKTISGNANGRQMRIALKSFDGSEKLNTHVSFTSNLYALTEAIENLSPGEDPSTNLHGALVEAQKFVSSHQVDGRGLKQKALIFFTDGKDQADRVDMNTAISSIRTAKNDIGLVYAVAVDGELEEKFLSNFGAKNEGYFLIDSKFKKLNDVFTKISEKLSGYADSYYVARVCTPKRKGNHKLSLKLDQNVINVDFNANNFGKGCDVSDESQWEFLAKAALLTSEQREIFQIVNARVKDSDELSHVSMIGTVYSDMYNQDGWMKNYSRVDEGNFTCDLHSQSRKGFPGDTSMYITNVVSTQVQDENGKQVAGLEFDLKDRADSKFTLVCSPIEGFKNKRLFQAGYVYFFFKK